MNAMVPIPVLRGVAVVLLALVLADVLTLLDDKGARRLLSLIVGFGPMLAAIAFLVWSRTMRELNVVMPADWLIRVQLYRVVGFVFLYPFFYYGVIPAGFALPAALGDMLTGGLAPVVASAVRDRRPHALTWAVAWNLFGILDLIVAPATAVMSGAQVLYLYPLSIVPLFLGPHSGF